MSGKKLAIFDLDGTLLDTVADLATVCNEVLRTYGFHTHPQESYKGFLGKGAVSLITRALEGQTDDPSVIANLVAEFRAIYPGKAQIFTQPYPGIPKLLEKLKQLGVTIAVLSNKPHAPTCQLIDHYFSGMVELSYGQREGIPLKPDPTVLLEMIAHFGADPKDCVYIGDTQVDIETAKNAGMPCVAVSWGFCTKDKLLEWGAQYIVDKDDELLQNIIDILAI